MILFKTGDCSLKCLKCLKSLMIDSTVKLCIQQHDLMFVFSHFSGEFSSALHRRFFHLFDLNFFLLEFHFKQNTLHIFFLISSHCHCFCLFLLIILSKLFLLLTYTSLVSVAAPSSLLVCLSVRRILLYFPLFQAVLSSPHLRSACVHDSPFSLYLYT